MIKKVSCIIMAFVIILASFCGCSTKEDNKVNNDESISFNNDICIIRGDNVDVDETKICTEFYNTMKEHYPDVEYKNDSTEASDKIFEILVGNTNRDETKQIKSELNDKTDGDYAVAVIENKIVIVGTDKKYLSLAIEYFLDNFVNTDLNNISKEFKYILNENVLDMKIINENIKNYKIVTIRDASYIYMSEVFNLRDVIFDFTGVELEIVDDRTEVGDYEILIGATNRVESKKLPDKEKYDISVVNKKIVLNAGESDALSCAVIYLTDFIKSKGKDSEEIVIGADLKHSGSYSYTDGKYKLVWNDEFDGDTLDTTKWTYRTGWNTMLYTDTEENTVVSNGTMKQIVRQNQNDKNETFYTASWLSTVKSMSFVYGYAEIRVLLPKGRGIWPAFWGNYSDINSNGYQEIDIFEVFPGNDSRLAFNLHKWWDDIDLDSGARIQRNSNLDALMLDKDIELENGEKLGDAWHTVGVVWDSKKMVALFDGKPYFEYDLEEDGDSFYHSPIYLIVNHIVTPADVGSEGETIFPNTMQTDYIRLYQIPNTGKLFLN